MDYLNIGSNGFAQVGDPLYGKKYKIEFNFLMEEIEKAHPIPEEFAGMCFYAIKKFDHEFGAYHEIVLLYDDIKLEDELIHVAFYNWFCDVESWDMETDYYNKAIKELWLNSLDIDNAEHLRIAV